MSTSGIYNQQEHTSQRRRAGDQQHFQAPMEGPTSFAPPSFPFGFEPMHHGQRPQQSYSSYLNSHSSHPHMSQLPPQAPYIPASSVAAPEIASSWGAATSSALPSISPRQISEASSLHREETPQTSYSMTSYGSYAPSYSPNNNFTRHSPPPRNALSYDMNSTSLPQPRNSSLDSNMSYASLPNVLGRGPGEQHLNADRRHSHMQTAEYGSAVSTQHQSDKARDPANSSQQKLQCWEHGCNGRVFSTFSNLLRHQREKAGRATKSVCPRCGAEFTRTTARNSHLKHAKCKARRGSGSAASE